MSINIPDNEQELIDQSRADVQEILPESNPFLANSFLDAMITAQAGRTFDFYRNLEELTKQLFIDTATGEFLDRLASFRNIFRNPATGSIGNIVFEGTQGTTIPISTTLQSSDSKGYTTTAETTIADNVISVSISRVGSVATAVSASPHNLATGIDATIADAFPADYNGTFSINVIDETSFSYSVSGSPSTPATGTITASYTTGIAPVSSDDQGADNNQDSGAILTLGTPIAGVNSSATVSSDGVTGATDEESDSDFRARAIEAWQDPATPFNVAGITKQAKLVSGVTRVFVREITPDVGQVTIYFTRDNDDDGPIPSGAEVNAVKDSILLIKPAHTNDDDVIVEAPEGLIVPFIISGISPNTTTMQTAIINNLAQLFNEGTDVGVTLKRNDYISAINRTVDTVTGDILKDFTVTDPTTDIVLASNQLPVLGSVSFT